MKTGIFVALAALAFTVFAIPDAQAWWWHHPPQDLNQRITGHIFSVDVDEETGNSTSLLNAIAKGQPGKAQLTAVIVFKSDFVLPEESDRTCPPDFPLEADIISFEWGETYNDGSLLAGAVDPDDPAQVFCLDFGITLAIANLTGMITGGTGRFEGASGTWKGTASSPTANTTAVGSIRADLN